MTPLRQVLVIVGVALALIGAGLALDRLFGSPAPRAPNPIPAENQAVGSDGWALRRPGYLVADDVQGQIKGYAGSPSVNKGGILPLYVSVAPAQTFSVDVYRIGWYGGQGGRLMQQIGPLDGVEQPACPQNPDTGLTECTWAPSYQLRVQIGRAHV